MPHRFVMVCQGTPYGMYHDKPIIGIVGGIGSGKSFVARLFGEMGCLVIDSDEQIRRAYQLDEVKQALRNWWGPQVIGPDGQVDRRAIAGRVFYHPEERQRLEGLLHPMVARMRDEAMSAAVGDPAVVAFVWDAPLLLEAGLEAQCDAIVYVDVPEEERLRRVQSSRGWTREEWLRREKIQLPLDMKRKVAKYMVRNTAGADEIRSQVREVLSRILADIRR